MSQQQVLKKLLKIKIQISCFTRKLINVLATSFLLSQGRDCERSWGGVWLIVRLWSSVTKVVIRRNRKGPITKNCNNKKTRTRREVGTLQNVNNVALSCFELPVVAGVTHDKVKRYYQRFKNILLCRNWIHTHGNKFIPELMKLLCEKVQLLILDPSIDICMLFQFGMLRAFLDLVANWLVTNTWSWMGHDIGLALHAL